MPTALPDAFTAFTLRNEPLAKYTYLKIGGPAEYLCTPRTVAELAKVVAWTTKEKLPLRVLGDGTNLLVREQAVAGVVLRLAAPEFQKIEIDGKRVRVGGGASLAKLIHASAGAGLAGFETLVGITATVGGALRFNAGDRQGEIADYFLAAHVIDESGTPQVRDRRELQFGDHKSDIEDPVIHGVEFELEADKPDNLVRRLRRAWIHRKAELPYPHETAIRMFRTPKGFTVQEAVSPIGMSRLKNGGARVSERNPNYLIAGPEATSKDILDLVEAIQGKVKETGGLALEREFSVW